MAHLTPAQKQQLLEISVRRASSYRRKYFRQIFEACRADGYGIAGYKHILQEAIAMADRTAEAIAILERD